MEHSLHSDQPVPQNLVKQEILLGVGLFYAIVAFILGVTFWTGEILLGVMGCLLYFPVLALFLVKFWRMDLKREKGYSETAYGLSN